MNNCDDIERIKKKIEEEQKKYKFCYIQGPTGPKGERGLQGVKGEKGDPGPATIQVGEVETIDFDKSAEVYNVGTSKDVVLEFKIPRGKQGIEGKIGPQGIQGLKGEQGERGLQGVKGEKGDPGPATIQVGEVETVDFDKSAEVVNTGTATDVVLDFKIPRGVKGDKGEQGPRGLPGEIGRTEHISIDETETLEAGSNAEVLDTFENWVHHLSFFIPKGDKGEQGPRGTSFVSAYGIRYSMTETQLNLEQGVDTKISLPSTGTAFFTEYPDDNSIKIKENGVYLISYLLCGATNEECSLTISVRANDLLQPATDTTTEFQAQIINSISGSTIVSLQPDDIITLNVKPSKTINISFNGSTNAMLSVVKIH